MIMNIKTFVQGIVYLFMYGKLAATFVFGYLPWFVDYSKGTLFGPGYGFFILGEIFFGVLVFVLALILLRFSTRKYRITVLPLILVLLFDIGFYFLDSSVGYSRSW